MKQTTEGVFELIVDLLLQNNLGQVFIMEEVTTEQIQITQEAAPKSEKKDEDQLEVSYINQQGYVQDQNYNQNTNQQVSYINVEPVIILLREKQCGEPW